MRVHDRPLQVFGKAGVAVRVDARARIAFLAGADARGGGADDQRDALGAMARDQRIQHRQQPIGLQGQPCQAVVAALPAGK
jgi:hypothetical protein